MFLKLVRNIKDFIKHYNSTTYKLKCYFCYHLFVLFTFSLLSLVKIITIMKEEILEAKRRLYLLLIKLNKDTITDNEVEIMFLLSKDEQIQSLLEKENKK